MRAQKFFDFAPERCIVGACARQIVGARRARSYRRKIFSRLMVVCAAIARVNR
jgi:hypothetical protein